MPAFETAITRREALRLSGLMLPGLLLPASSARAANPPAGILTRTIPRTGEALPVVGLGTAVNFDAGQDMARRVQLAAVLQALADGGGKLVDTASSYGSAEEVIGALAAQGGLRPRLFSRQSWRSPK